MITIKREISPSRLWGYYSNVGNRELIIYTSNEDQRVGNIPNKFNTPFNHLLCVLHEQRHVYWDHPSRESIVNLIDVMIKEVEAWAFALNCLKKEYGKKALHFIIYCLGTYNKKIIKEYGEGISIEALISLLETKCLKVFYNLMRYSK